MAGAAFLWPWGVARSQMATFESSVNLIHPASLSQLTPENLLF